MHLIFCRNLKMPYCHFWVDVMLIILKTKHHFRIAFSKVIPLFLTPCAQLYIYSRKLYHFITILYFRYVARVSTDACALNMLGILLERQRHFRTAKRFTVADFFIWNPLKNSQLYSLALKNFIGFLKYS